MVSDREGESERKPMPTLSTPSLQTRNYDAPRAQVCARALVISEGKPATEHMTYDLSTGGTRLCGQPLATVGDELQVLLQLPEGEVRASGQLLRVGSVAGAPDFAIQFAQLEPRDEDAIQDAVLDALTHPDRRSVLLLQNGPDLRWPGWGWLRPVSPICAAAVTPLDAVRCLQEHAIAMAILGRHPGHGPRACQWSEALPELPWRTIDPVGRLHLPVTTSRLGF
jgi:hypothetical protein